MNLEGRRVKHKAFGEGQITESDENYIKVVFPQKGEYKFPYPGGFDKFLKLIDADLAETVEQDLRKKKEEAKAQAEKKARELEEEIRRRKERVKGRKSIKEERENVVFKCNFCNGGRSDNQVGFLGLCSDEIIKYNIRKKHRSWCSYETCPCKLYLDGQISRMELEDKYAKEGVCYESAMLRDWKAQAGTINYGEKKGTPKTLRKVQPSSLSVLTTLEPDSKSEAERIIFGVFIVNHIFEGGDDKEGFVQSTSGYRLKFSPEQAQELKFWKYHKNDEKPEKPRWGQGLHRYLTDDEAVQILKDAVRVKAGTEDEQLAKDLLEHFCEINKINANEVGEPQGALTLI